MPEPLPLLPSSYSNPSWRHAYDKCQEYEQAAQIARDEPGLVRARILGYSMLETPDDDGRDCLASEINSCSDDASFRRLATSYINHILRRVRAAKGDTPTPSDHPSRSSFDNDQAYLSYLLKEAPPSRRSAKTKALKRDGYRCLLTGEYDYDSVVKMQRVQPPSGYMTNVTQIAHIFPASTNVGSSGRDEYGPKHEYAASVWAVMARFGNQIVFDELNGADVHKLENVMTLSPDKHHLFDSLDLWLESTTVPNTYRPNSTSPMARQRIPPTVTFTSSDPANYPLPSPIYLRLHAAAARVAHLSGAGEYVEKVLRDMEETRVLSDDGSSADLLASALGAISVHIVVFLEEDRNVEPEGARDSVFRRLAGKARP